MAFDPALRPSASEYAPFYHGYISSLPDGSILETLERQTGETMALITRIPEARGTHRYAEGKWSIKEVLLHVIDAERIFAMRALCFARGEDKMLPGFDENAYVPMSDANARSLLSLSTEYAAVRSASMQLWRNLPEAAWSRTGNANGKTISVRALAWIMAGHDAHHTRILQERYL